MTAYELYKKIKEELKKEGGLKARIIARRLAVERREVNRILYSTQYGSAFRKNDAYMWFLTDDIPVEAKAETKPAPASCKKCMLYKDGSCIGEKQICEFFKNSPDISAFEMSLWPKEMAGPYGTLHC